MIIGGYTLTTGFNSESVTVSEYEAGWSFHLQGDDAARFLDEWEEYQGSEDYQNFSSFLYGHEYDDLFR